MTDVSGHIVTIDSIGCQLTIVEKITERKADYVIGLKKNQKNLYKAADEHFTAGVRVFEKESTAEYGHGRMEIREYYLETNVSRLEQREDWAGLKSVGMVKSCVFRNGKSTCSTRYYISSLTETEEFAYAVREHWAIENKLHWSPDVIFRGDSDLAKTDNAPLNLNIPDKFALYLVSQVDLGKISRKHKRYKAVLNPDVLLSMILGGK